MNDTEEVMYLLTIGRAIIVANFLLNTGRGLKSAQLCKECLILLMNIDPKKQEERVELFKTGIYRTIIEAYYLIPDYSNAFKYGKELLSFYRECGKTDKEGILTMELAAICLRQCRYAEAQELCKTAISFMRETGNRKGEGIAHGYLGIISLCLSEYVKAKEYCEKALTISVEIGDRKLEAAVLRNLGNAFQPLGEYAQAKEYHEKALTISVETGDRNDEATDLENLGHVLQSLCEYIRAKEYLQKALEIRMEIGDRDGEARDYGKLGTVFHCLGDYARAIEHHEKEVSIGNEIGNRERQALGYENLGYVFKSISENAKAKEYLEKALSISMEIGDRKGEATALKNLGAAFQFLGDHARGIEYLEKAVLIYNEIGDKDGEASVYQNLGLVLRYHGEKVQAKEYCEKALEIRNKIGGRKAEKASSFENQADLYQSLGKYLQAKECHENALSIRMEIGDREGVPASYVRLGHTFKALGEYQQAKEYFEKALAIYIDIGLREPEAAAYEGRGTIFLLLGDLVTAESYLEKGLSISTDIGIPGYEFKLCNILSVVKLLQGKIKEACYYLRLSIKKSEDLRGLLKDNHQLKISFSDTHKISCRNFIPFFCSSENANTALYVLELGRARALADLMAAQYSGKIEQISTSLLSWDQTENVMKKESNCTCLYISYFAQHVFLWILTTSGVIHFRRNTVIENDAYAAGFISDLDQFFAKNFCGYGNLPKESCEDRSLKSKNPKPNSPQEESLPDLRLVEEDDEGYQDPEPLFYKMLIAPAADLLVEPEIIIVPESSLYQVPFAALRDEDGKYLSETFRIRTIPSLTTLKLIQDSPADYHSQTGALIVGDPVVGRVLYKGSVENLKPLPCARKEAEMIGQLLGVAPLLGEHATKQAVLRVIHSVSLIHFAAHGNAERGEIALSPLRSINRIPQEEEYLLTMSDISQVQLRAKLVVLSCCHSGNGQIRAEGVIGIARAFLGSGARSVLVALWALEDSATEQLMRRLYEHLVRGESASESLHEAMKWMRCNGYSEVRQWAPFMLIGDNVTFDFGGKDGRP